MTLTWDWQESAECRGESLALFFGAEGERPPARDIRERAAKEVCSSCSVQAECLEYALSRPEKYGIWVLTEEERKDERRRRQRRALRAAEAS